MDFIEGLPLTSQRHTAILVAVNKLTKRTHFVLVKDIFNITDVAQVIISEFIHLHGFPKKIILDRDSQFTSAFWTILLSALCNIPLWRTDKTYSLRTLARK
jgi:hypothetical protein